MAENVFKTVTIREGDDIKAQQWYKNEVNRFSRNGGSTQLPTSIKTVNRVQPGQMYLFIYDPKYKEKLPYYDAAPLVLPFRMLPDGFLGINIHYLPHIARFNLLGELSKLVINTSITDDTRIRLSWQILNSSSRFLGATSCVKHYLSAHVRSSFLRIGFNDWKTAAMLPVEKFKKGRKQTAWKDNSKKYGL
jgi:hypothetical protein